MRIGIHCVRMRVISRHSGISVLRADISVFFLRHDCILPGYVNCGIRSRRAIEYALRGLASLDCVWGNSKCSTALLCAFQASSARESLSSFRKVSRSCWKFVKDTSSTKQRYCRNARFAQAARTGLCGLRIY